MCVYCSLVTATTYRLADRSSDSYARPFVNLLNHTQRK